MRFIYVYLIFIVGLFGCTVKGDVKEAASSSDNTITILDQKELTRPVMLSEFMKLRDLYPTPITRDEWKSIYDESCIRAINPLIPLMKVQVEQGLVFSSTTNNLIQRKNRACGFGSYAEYTTGTKKYYGFKTQISYCVEFFDKYGVDTQDLPEVKTYDYDRKIIKPGNGLTKALFKYCPKYDKYPNADGSDGTGNIQIPGIYNKLLRDLLSVRKGMTKTKRILLTFDDSSSYVPLIMDKLNERRLYAIFFLNNMDPKLEKSVYSKAEKYSLDIGNHTKKHSGNLVTMSYDEVLNEISGFNTTIQLFRPPYLCLSSTVCDVVKTQGYNYLLGVGGDDASVDSTLWSIVNHLNNSDSVVAILHNNKNHFTRLDEIIDFLGSLGVFSGKEDVETFPEFITDQDIRNKIQYFARPWNKTIKLKQDLQIKSRPGGTYPQIGVVESGKQVKVILKFDWKWVDAKLEDGVHQWAMLKNGGWIWISGGFDEI